MLNATLKGIDVRLNILGMMVVNPQEGRDYTITQKIVNAEDVNRDDGK